VERLRKLKIVL